MAGLTRYEPWSLLNQLHDEMDRMFGNRTSLQRSENAAVATSDWIPSVDIKDEKDRYIIHADVPGVDPKDIHVSMENGVLTIKGEKESEKKEEREGYKRVERSRGSFYRSFTMPDTVDADSISAKSRNGVLELVVPKLRTVKSRKIEVEG